MSPATEAIRVCRTHGSTCTVRDDVVICPSGSRGGHKLFDGQWAVATGRRSAFFPGAQPAAPSAADLEGPALVAQRAREAWLRGRRETKAAIAELVSEARANPRIMAALLAPYIETAAADAIHLAASGGKVHSGVDLAPGPDISVTTRPPAPPARGVAGNPDRALADSGLELLGQNNLRTLSMFILPNRQPLGFATRSIVRECAQEMARRVRGAAVQARWLALIARDRRMAGVANVSEAFNEEQLAELLVRATSDVARVIAAAPSRPRLNASPLAAPRPPRA